MRSRTRSLLVILASAVLFLLAPAPAAQANVDDFSYAYWSSDYQVSLDEDGRSVAYVTETLVARFPDYDQNRGIVRGIPERYLGADVQLRVESITDENGAAVPYEIEEDDGTVYLLLGDDDYVHGLTAYVIEYSMHDIMILGTESGNDEFYWNMLPLNSTQPIEEFEASVTFSPALSAALTGDAACYQGYAGQTDRCAISGPVETGAGTAFHVASGWRAPGDGVTLAIGFTAGTVSQPPARIPNPVTDITPLVLTGGGLVTAIGGGIALSRFRSRKRTATGVIVAQFDVPESLPPLLAAAIYPGARNIVPAQIIHLAVRGVLRIEDLTAKKPVLRLVDPSRARDSLDDAMTRALFRKTPVGETFEMPKSSSKFAARMQKTQALGVEEATTRGLVSKQRSRAAATFFWVTLALTVIAVTIAAIGAISDRESAVIALIVSAVTGGAFTLVTGILAAPHRTHTDEGARAYEYLRGVREFITIAEADRLRMLQSVTGAERYTEGGAEVVHLYERLLPYAMLFGEEKSWGKALEVAYERTHSQPNWMNMYVASSFASNLSSFQTSAQSSASYSSSSGGSTGGGFSGGGGGGGFSGGR